MVGDPVDILPRAELRGLVEHLNRRLYLLVAVFLVSFIVGYPAAEDVIEWLRHADGYKPDGVQIVILQPMEVVLLRLRIAFNLGMVLVALTLMCDLGWNGRAILSLSLIHI